LYAPKELQDRIRPWEFPIGLLPSVKKIVRQLWASVFDIELLGMVAEHLDGIKIASGDLTYSNLVRKAAEVAAEKKIPLAISDGAATEDEIRKTIKEINQFGVEPIVLHCVSSYPATWPEYGMRFLGKLPTLGKISAIGLSDHTTDEMAGILALAFNVTYFEHHFRPSAVPGAILPPDWGAWAFFPAKFEEYIDKLQKAEKWLGTGRKQVAQSEMNERIMARRSVEDWLRPRREGRI
jgi:N-acetylneuraminate synthase